VRGIDIRRMSKGDVEEASRLIASAFADNPNTLAVTRGDRAKAQRIMQAGVRVAKLGRKCSYVLIAEEAGRIVGVLNAAEWPNCQMRIGERDMVNSCGSHRGQLPGSGMSEAAHKCHRRDHSRPRIWGWACSRASASTRRVGEGAILGAGRLGPPRQMRRRGVVLARPRLLGRGSGLPRSSQTLGRPRLVLTSCSGGTASALRTDGCAAGWAAGPVGWPRRRAGDWRSGCHTKRPRAADP
jgi:hypothetical protein